MIMFYYRLFIKCLVTYLYCYYVNMHVEITTGTICEYDILLYSIISITVICCHTNVFLLKDT